MPIEVIVMKSCVKLKSCGPSIGRFSMPVVSTKSGRVSAATAGALPDGDGRRYERIVGHIVRHWDVLADAFLSPLLRVPRHPFTLARFLDLVRDRYDVVVGKTPTVTLARATLPYREVLVLPGS